MLDLNQHVTNFLLFYKTRHFYLIFVFCEVMNVFAFNNQCFKPASQINHARKYFLRDSSGKVLESYFSPLGSHILENKNDAGTQSLKDSWKLARQNFIFL